jgi:hypothetical protein
MQWGKHHLLEAYRGACRSQVPGYFSILIRSSLRFRFGHSQASQVGHFSCERKCQLRRRIFQIAEMSRGHVHQVNVRPGCRIGRMLDDVDEQIDECGQGVIKD